VVALFGDQHFDIGVSAERHTVVVSTSSRFAAAAIAFVLVMTNPVASLFFCVAGCGSVVSETKRGHRNRVRIISRPECCLTLHVEFHFKFWLNFLPTEISSDG
jgi:hypothetical protein